MGSKILKVLECVSCGDRYSSEHVELEKYYPSTGICRKCYQKGLKISDEIWCFGGYNAIEYRECRIECPDRKVCKEFSKIKIEENRDGEIRR